MFQGYHKLMGKDGYRTKTRDNMPITFQKAVRFLKTIAMTKKPIKVRRVLLNGFDGTCEDKEGFFLVKINKDLTEAHSIDVLLHEVAHAEAEAWDDSIVHGEEWALSYGRLYRLWETFIGDQK